MREGIYNFCMPKSSGIAEYPLRAYGGTILSVVSVLYLIAFPLFFFSYLGDAIVDYGGELYLYWRLADGARLYRDLDYLYGPIPLFLSELGYRLGGRGGVVTLNVLSALSVLVLTQAFFCKFFGPLLAGLVLFFTVIFFGTNTVALAQNYNFYTPYKAGALYGLFFSAAAFLCCSWPRLESKAKSPGWHLSGGLLAAACFLSKQEHSLALAVGLFVLFGTRVLMDGKAPTWRIDFASFLGGFLFLTAATLLVLSGRSGESLARAAYWILHPYLALLNGGVTGQKLYVGMSGVGDTSNVLLALLQLLLLCTLGFLAYQAAARNRTWKVSPFAEIGLLVLLPLFTFWLTPLFELFYSTHALYRALPLGCALLFCCSVFEALRRKKLSSNQAVFLAAAAFSGTLCLKTFFGFRIAHYAFALGPPAFTLLLLTLFFLGEKLRREKGSNAQAIFVGLLLTLGLAQAAVVPRIGAEIRKERPIAVNVRGTSFQTDQLTALALYHFTDELKLQMKDPSATLTVLPEGNFFNWATERKSPLRFLSLYPDQFALNGEEKILKQMTDFPSSYIAFYPRNLEEYGEAGFARGLGQGVMRWIEARYVKLQPSEQHRDAWTKLGMELWKRRESE